ncbi:methyl-accepting chemotaxis protein [Rhizobium sp. SGZ-381]|uniref:methyl-accepting chemotaxis protein n=1 Tax=Rhizobium sp. SGZ-381 TaxID=3342800 RepID=UPI0036717C10
MALVKTSQLGAKAAIAKGEAATITPAPAGADKAAALRRSRDRSRMRQQKAAERLGAATEELSTGVAEAASAAEQLRRALEQIASGAEEAAGAVHESLSATTHLAARFTETRTQAETARNQTGQVQTGMLEAAAQIDGAILAIETNASRQIASVSLIEKLQVQAETIGATTVAVADISDRTNLLALNAAIEAARAGDEGRGFAVVADEVRALAEIAERSSRDVNRHAETIVEGVGRIAERIRSAAQTAREQTALGRNMVADLEAIRLGLSDLSQDSQTILIAAVEADVATREAQKGAETVAAAAEQQSAAAAQAQRAVEQQSVALEESQQTAQALAAMADELLNDDAHAARSQEMSAAAEELSATVQELSGAAGEILIAVEQISRGAEAQASATEQANAAMTQIKASASRTEVSAQQASRRGAEIKLLLSRNKAGLASLASGISGATAEMRQALADLNALGDIGFRIERTVDRIVLVAVQTNMLAVSGSVEAARAGTAGRGFAIVSTDIRKLAQDAADNIDGIKDIVRLIQLQIVTVQRELEAIIAASDAEQAKSQLIADRLASAEDDVDGMVDGFAAILEAAQSILISAREVQGGTEQIASVALQASAAARQAATAALQQSRGAEDLAAAVEEIASLADELQMAGS